MQLRRCYDEAASIMPLKEGEMSQHNFLISYAGFATVSVGREFRLLKGFIFPIECLDFYW
jgi:hypothetical protein